MPFFKDIAERIGDYTLTLTITRDKGQLIVMLVPKIEAKKDDAIKEIIPLTVKGTPDQLDAGFILAISQGIQMTTGLQTNIKEFEASIKKAEKKVKGKDDKKPDTKAESTVEGTDDEDPETDDDNEVPFGDADVDKDTGEVKTPTSSIPAPKTDPIKPKSVEPKAKEPAAPKEPKPTAASTTALTGQLMRRTGDNGSNKIGA
jgi:PRTRC genetic system protein E